MTDREKRPKWRTVRVSVETFELIERLRSELFDSYVAGQATALVPSDRKEAITQAALIGRAVELLDDHRKRGNRRGKR
jgi:hypothetical protein